MQRATWLDFVEDRTTHYLDRQFMLGSSLLVAPVFVPSSEETEYYLPAGRWTSFWSPGRTIAGPTWVKEKVAVEDIPVWVRAGSLLLLGPRGAKRPDYDYARDLEVRVYELSEGETSEASVPSGKGTEIAGIVRAQRVKGELKVWIVEGELTLSTVAWFIGSSTPKSIVGAKQRPGEGLWLDVEKGVKEVKIQM